MSVYDSLAWDVADYIKIFGATKSQDKGGRAGHNIGAAATQHTAYTKALRACAVSIEAFDVAEAEKACREKIALAKVGETVTEDKIEDRLRVALAYASRQDPESFILPSVGAEVTPDAVTARDNATGRASLIDLDTYCA